MRRLFVVVGLLASPLAARAGACVYSTEGQPEGQEATAATAAVVCTYLDDAASCAAEAAKHGSAEWLQAHPQRFVAGLGCNQAVAGAKSGKPAQLPAPAKRAAK